MNMKITDVRTIRNVINLEEHVLIYIYIYTSYLNMTIFRLLYFIITDKILATLGEGTFGKVVKVKELNS